MTTYLAWDDDGEASNLADLDSLARFGQRLGRRSFGVHRIDPEFVSPRLVFWRFGARWELADNFGVLLETVAADPSDDPRVLTIVDMAAGIDFLTAHRVPLAEWATGHVADPMSTWARFGHLPPAREDGEVRWYYCPDLIAAQTAHLGEPAFLDYLRIAITLRMGLAVQNPHLRPQEFEDLLDQITYHADPIQCSLVSETQMRVLDAS